MTPAAETLAIVALAVFLGRGDARSRHCGNVLIRMLPGGATRRVQKTGEHGALAVW